MDLIYTDANRIDQGVFSAYAFDLSFGAADNDFEVTLSADYALDSGAYVYVENTEYGGIVDYVKASTDGATVTYGGRTWHGILNSKVLEPDTGDDYLIVSGEANGILAAMIDRMGLSGLFSADSASSGITISRYQFYRYCKGYDGLTAMLAANNAKLQISWTGRNAVLAAAPVADYTDAGVDRDVAKLSIEQHYTKVNHLVCLGAGELAEREVLHLYADKNGDIGYTQYYTGLEEVTEVYDSSVTDELEADARERFKLLRDVDTADVNITDGTATIYDIGDIVGATEYRTGIKIAEKVTQKIVKINNGVLDIEYRVGG